jgi:hypothetical protein
VVAFQGPVYGLKLGVAINVLTDDMRYLNY